MQQQIDKRVQQLYHWVIEVDSKARTNLSRDKWQNHCLLLPIVHGTLRFSLFEFSIHHKILLVTKRISNDFK